MKDIAYSEMVENIDKTNLLGDSRDFYVQERNTHESNP